jgi:hypothetical protein
MFKGQYNGKGAHAPDLDAVLQRAWDAGDCNGFRV